MNDKLKNQSITKYFVVIKKEEIVDFELDFDNHQNIQD